MGISGKNAASVGLGCLVDVALFVVLVLAFPEDCAVSTLIYMMAMAIPVWIVRIAVFNEGTPRWARILIGPLGALVCLALAIAHPIALEDSSEADETPATNNVSSAAGSASPATNAVESVEEVLAELDSLVGLEEVKSEVRKIVNLAKVNEARRAQGLKVPPMTYHMVFTGNPGTGKTTVARIVARAFRALGIAKTGQLVETDRSGLVGRYEGETAVKTNAKIDEAIGGILFVDEAYQLVSGENDDYGKEAIATLLKRMEDDRDRLRVRGLHGARARRDIPLDGEEERVRARAGSRRRA